MSSRRLFANRDRAIGAALRKVKQRMLERQAVCVQMYASANVISVYELKGAARHVLARFGWPETP